MGTKKMFTQEELEILKRNPYTKKVTADTISYTHDFKEAFWTLSLRGYFGTEAFQELGYDPAVLGCLCPAGAAAGTTRRRRASTDT